MLVEVNDASSPFTQFKESKLLSQLIRKPKNETLSSCFEELDVLSSKEVFRMYFKVSLILLHHIGTPI